MADTAVSGNKEPLFCQKIVRNELYCGSFLFVFIKSEENTNIKKNIQGVVWKQKLEIINLKWKDRKDTQWNRKNNITVIFGSSTESQISRFKSNSY